MSRRPVLGIMCCGRNVGDELAQLVMDRYVDAAMRFADCAALLVPARSDLMQAAEVADRLDGLLLTGSPSNIEPHHYGDPGPGTGPFDPGRDETSQALIKAMMARGRPVFGICRGLQELNVAFGGSLRRDLSDAGRALPHHASAETAFGAMFDHHHEVRLSEGGVLATALQRAELVVNSVHYQGIDRIGRGLTIEAIAPDGNIEAVSAAVGGSVLLGVQWHPEWETRRDSASQAFFALLGRALRGDTAAWGL
jgi:putative glutamine amidotransferase